MDVQRLIGEVARRHNVLVDPDDPIFVTVILNELLLSEHLTKVQGAIAASERSVAAGARRHLESARGAATQVIAESAACAAEHVRAAGVEVRAQLQSVLREALTVALTAAVDSARHRRNSQWAAGIAVAGASIVVLAFGVFLIGAR